jgi:hypothetical protein
MYGERVRPYRCHAAKPQGPRGEIVGANLFAKDGAAVPTPPVTAKRSDYGKDMSMYAAVRHVMFKH